MSYDDDEGEKVSLSVLMSVMVPILHTEVKVINTLCKLGSLKSLFMTLQLIIMT